MIKRLTVLPFAGRILELCRIGSIGEPTNRVSYRGVRGSYHISFGLSRNNAGYGIRADFL